MLCLISGPGLVVNSGMRMTLQHRAVLFGPLHTVATQLGLSVVQALLLLGIFGF